jgi:hypothetical protein
MNLKKRKSQNDNELSEDKNNTLKIDNFDNVNIDDELDINCDRLVYDIFTKSFVPYDQYMRDYKNKMYGVKSKFDKNKCNPDPESDYFD